MMSKVSNPASLVSLTRRSVFLLLSLSAFFYLTSVYKIATSKDPFIDEGWIASPGYNLAFKGNMGTTVLEPSGSWLAAS